MQCLISGIMFSSCARVVILMEGPGGGRGLKQQWALRQGYKPIKFYYMAYNFVPHSLVSSVLFQSIARVVAGGSLMNPSVK